MTQNKWTWQLPFLLFLCVATVFVIRRHAPAGSLARPVGYQHSEGNVFGTVWHATYQCDSSLRHSIVRELRRVDASLSMFNPKSCISRINRGEDVPADSMIGELFLQAGAISQATDGAFDITVAPLVNAWGFGIRHDSLPDSSTVDSLRTLVGWQRVKLRDGRIVKDDSRMVFDFSAIAKGYGADCVARLLASRGIRNYMIEIGGEIVCHGTNAEGEPWRIGINKPTAENDATAPELQAILRFTDCAMATSGNYRNYFVRDGVRYAHTIDPRTGYPVQRSIVSSTVLAPTCAMADGFATAFMVMGIEGALRTLRTHPELKAYLIYVDDTGEMQTWHSEGLDIE